MTILRKAYDYWIMSPEDRRILKIRKQNNAYLRQALALTEQERSERIRLALKGK
tara:strand:- start:1988 stop:2149 length:162 start_codon:yes stop_codon:yes gene_type:complete